MTLKQILNSGFAPDGSQYTTLTDGAGNLSPAGSGAVTQGNPPWAVDIVDSTNTNITAVKPASTAALAADPALVITVSPNSVGIVALGAATPSNSIPVVNAGFTYGNMTTATTTTFKSGAGVLHSITVNSLGTVASAVSVFDNTAGSGTSIAVINSLTTGQATYTYDVAFSTGLTVTTTGTVAPNVTVSYR